MKRDADLFALVLEDVDVLDVIERAEFSKAIRPDRNQFVDLREWFASQSRIVVRRVEHNFADALRGRNGIKLRACDGWRGRVRLQRGKAILEDDEVVSGFRDFRGKATGRCRAERTVIRRRQEGALLSVRCGRQPLAQEWIPPQLRHGAPLLIPSQASTPLALSHARLLRRAVARKCKRSNT